VIDCNEWRTEKRHECANMGKVKRLELWWQLYRTSFPVLDLENFRPMDFCWHECTVCIKLLWVTDVRVLSTRTAYLAHEYIPIVSRNVGRRWAVWRVSHARGRDRPVVVMPCCCWSLCNLKQWDGHDSRSNMRGRNDTCIENIGRKTRC